MRIDRQAWWRLPQQGRFLIAGGINTLVGYLIFAALYLLLHRYLHYLAVAVVSQALAVTSAFIVHRRLVFSSDDDWFPSFLRFNVSQLLSFGFGLAGLFGLVHFAKLSPLSAQPIVLAASVAVSYLLHRYYTFRRRALKAAA